MFGNSFESQNRGGHKQLALAFAAIHLDFDFTIVFEVRTRFDILSIELLLA